MQTASLIRATFPRGVSDLVASYTLAPPGADGPDIGLYGCLEQIVARQDSRDCNFGVGCAGRLDVIAYLFEKMPKNDERMDEAAQGAGYGGHLAIIDWFRVRGDKRTIRIAMFDACRGGRLLVESQLIGPTDCFIQAATEEGALRTLRSLERLIRDESDANWAFTNTCHPFNRPTDVRFDSFRAEPRDIYGVRRYLISRGATKCFTCNQPPSYHQLYP